MADVVIPVVLLIGFAVVTARGGQMNDIVKLSIFVLSKTEYKARGREIGAVEAERAEGQAGV